ncbi:hypothetical protein [Nostoc sp. PCC 9305]
MQQVYCLLSTFFFRLTYLRQEAIAVEQNKFTYNHLQNPAIFR